MKNAIRILTLIVSLMFSGAAFSQTNTNLGNATANNVYVKGPVPWVDVHNYGARTLPNTDTGQITTATTSGTSVTLASGSTDFIPKDGIVISEGGVATSQSTPSAPVITTLGVTGSSTVSYKCVGADALEGLTAASAAGSTTTAPTVFGNLPQFIASMSRSSNVVTVTFSAPINAVTDEHIVIENSTGGTTSFNGLFKVASAPTNSSITFAQTGANESATIVANATLGRLVNYFVISSITRTGNIMTITTDVAHNYVVGDASTNPTVVQIWGVQPLDMDGWYVVASTPTATTFTVTTGLNFVGGETGYPYIGSTVYSNGSWNTMGVMSWEANQVACPAVSGTTTFYYVYASYGGGAYNLIGATTPVVDTSQGVRQFSNIFKDWGPYLSQGYVAPPAAAVPATAPGSAQHQEYVGTISSISGANATVSPTVPTAVSGQGVYHDNSIAVQNAVAAACEYGAGGVGSNEVLFSGYAAFYYIFNAPFGLSSNPGTICPQNSINLRFSTLIWTNDTISINIPGYTDWRNAGSGFGAASAAGASYLNVSGYGNPLINAAQNQYGQASIVISGFTFSSLSGGQTEVAANGEYSRFEDSQFNTGYFGTSVGLWLTGTFQDSLHNTGLFGYPFPLTAEGEGPDGQPWWGPPIPELDVVSDSVSLLFDGIQNGAGKGIMFDASQGASTGGTAGTIIENYLTDQSPYTPLVMIWGCNRMESLTVKNVIMDSTYQATAANLGGCVSSLTLDTVPSGITGSPFNQVYTNGEGITGSPLGQNINSIEQASGVQNAIPVGPYSAPVYVNAETLDNMPHIFPANQNLPLAWAQVVTGVTAISSGGGTVAAGTHAVCVYAVGWNGAPSGDGGYGGYTTNSNESCQNVTVDGSHAVAVGWTDVSYAMGYVVTLDNQIMNATMIAATATSYSVTAIVNNGAAYGYPASGCPLVDQNGIECAPLVHTAGLKLFPVALGGSSDAISPHTAANYMVTKAGTDSMTLTAPTAGIDDGIVITVTSITANPHTITATSLLNNGGAGVPYTTATFAAHAGATITLMAYQGLWYVIAVNNVVLS